MQVGRVNHQQPARPITLEAIGPRPQGQADRVPAAAVHPALAPGPAHLGSHVDVRA